jgi:hypothetical protein
MCLSPFASLEAWRSSLIVIQTLSDDALCAELKICLLQM